MLEVYSNNVSVGVNENIPLNNVTLEKGCATQLISPTSIRLNKCGVYSVSVDAYGVEDGTVGDIGIQLVKNGALQPQAISVSNSSAATDLESVSFKTLVQVPEDNNSNCCCSSPVIINVQNVGVAAQWNHVNVVVEKVKC